MKLRNQFIISIVIVLAILVMAIGSIIVTNQQITQVYADQDSAANVERGADYLNVLSSEYFLYQDNSQITAWQSVYTAILGNLSNITPSNSQQQTLLHTISTDLDQLNESFNSLASYLQAQPRNISVRVLPEFQQLWSQIVVQHQNLGIDGAQLSLSLRNEADGLRVTNILLIVSVVSLFAIYLIATYFLFYRRTLRGISNLQKGTAILGAGNLGYRISANSKDEIGDLTTSFNQMADNLNTVTTSKLDLEKEVGERKKAQEELKQRTEQLEQTQTRLEEKAAEVEEYANQMEQLANQRLEKLRESERLAAIGQTAGMVGHDIRNPLQAISGDAFLISEELKQLPKSENRHAIEESVEAIEQNVVYVNKIVSDLQDYNRPLTPKLEAVKIRDCAETVIQQMQIPKNIELSLLIDPTIEIKSDATSLLRIFVNLFTNAVQAMPNGGKLIVSVFKEEEKVVIAVQDTGVGIPKNAKENLFKPLFTTKSKGQGLGLAVVKRFVETLDGTITFESHEGKGTKFTIELPNK